MTSTLLHPLQRLLGQPACTAPSTLTLAPGQALPFEPGPGHRTLRVLAGQVWLTQSGDRDDHFLRAGARHALATQGRVVLENDGRMPARVLWE